MAISQQLLDAINQAEDSLAAAQAADGTVTADQGAVSQAQATLTNDQATAASAHAKATTDAQAAIDLLRQELQLPANPSLLARKKKR